MSSDGFDRPEAGNATIPTALTTAPTSHDLHIDPVTTHGWRVSDRRVPPGAPFGFLAFIEQRGEVFEVIQLGVGLEWHEFDSLSKAMRFIAEIGSRAARQHLSGRTTTR